MPSDDNQNHTIRFYHTGADGTSWVSFVGGRSIIAAKRSLSAGTTLPDGLTKDTMNFSYITIVCDDPKGHSNGCCSKQTIYLKYLFDGTNRAVINVQPTADEWGFISYDLTIDAQYLLDKMKIEGRFQDVIHVPTKNSYVVNVYDQSGGSGSSWTMEKEASDLEIHAKTLLGPLDASMDGKRDDFRINVQCTKGWASGCTDLLLDKSNTYNNAFSGLVTASDVVENDNSNENYRASQYPWVCTLTIHADAAAEKVVNKHYGPHYGPITQEPYKSLYGDWGKTHSRDGENTDPTIRMYYNGTRWVLCDSDVTASSSQSSSQYKYTTVYVCHDDGPDLPTLKPCDPGANTVGVKVYFNDGTCPVETDVEKQELSSYNTSSDSPIQRNGDNMEYPWTCDVFFTPSEWMALPDSKTGLSSAAAAHSFVSATLNGQEANTTTKLTMYWKADPGKWVADMTGSDDPLELRIQVAHNPYVAKNVTTDQPYIFLSLAVDDAKDGQTIELLSDATVSKTDKGFVEQAPLSIRKSITLEGHGHKIIADQNNWVLADGSSDPAASVISVGVDDRLVAENNKTVNATIQNVEIVGHANLKNGIWAHAYQGETVTDASTTLLLKNVKISDCGVAGVVVDRAHVTVQDEGTGGTSSIGNGGAGYAIDVQAGGVAAVPDGVSGLISAPAKIGSIYYGTLEQAIAAAGDSNVVVLLADAGPVTLTGSVRVDPNEHAANLTGCHTTAGGIITFAPNHDFTGTYTKVSGKNEHDQQCSRCNVRGVVIDNVQTPGGSIPCSGQADCTHPAVCTDCGNEHTAAQGHHFTIDLQQFEDDGHKVHNWKCSRENCNVRGYMDDNDQPVIGSVICSDEEGDTTATCTTAATCKVCQGSYGDPRGHDFKGPYIQVDGTNTHNQACSHGCGARGIVVGDVQTVDGALACSGGEATCTEKATCTDCKFAYGTSLGGHNAEGSVAHKDATCTEDGVEGGTYCTRCNDGKAAAEAAITALGHNWGDWASNGYGTDTRTCSVCQAADTRSTPGYVAPSYPAYTPTAPSNPSTPSESSTPSDPGNIEITEPDVPLAGLPTGDDVKSETVENADGSTTTKVETADGSKAEVIKQEDGSLTSTATMADGTTAKVEQTAAGVMTAEIKVSEAAAASGEAVAVVIPEVPVAQTSAEASTVKVEVPASVTAQAPVKVELPIAAADAKPGTVAILVKEDGTEEIVKTSYAADGSLVVPVTGTATVKIVDNSVDFADTRDHWSKDAVDFVSARELFNGTQTATESQEAMFSPNTNMTRGMLFTVLARLDGQDTSGGSTWYDAGLTWAVDNGLTDGTAPSTNVSREQLATILYRYAGSPAVSGDLSAHPDSGNVSDWAKDAMAWAVEQGIISGTDTAGTLAPGSSAMRAVVSTMLMRFVAKNTK